MLRKVLTFSAAGIVFATGYQFAIIHKTNEEGLDAQKRYNEWKKNARSRKLGSLDAIEETGGERQPATETMKGSNAPSA